MMRSWGEGPSERNPGRSLTPAAVRGHSETAVCEPGAEFSPGTGAASPLILDLSASRSVRKKLLLVISHPVHGILLQWLGQANGRISDVSDFLDTCLLCKCQLPGAQGCPRFFHHRLPKAQLWRTLHRHSLCERMGCWPSPRIHSRGPH